MGSGWSSTKVKMVSRDVQVPSSPGTGQRAPMVRSSSSAGQHSTSSSPWQPQNAPTNYRPGPPPRPRFVHNTLNMSSNINYSLQWVDDHNVRWHFLLLSSLHLCHKNENFDRQFVLFSPGSKPRDAESLYFVLNFNPYLRQCNNERERQPSTTTISIAHVYWVCRARGKKRILDPWILLDPIGSYWILLDPDGSCWILLDPRIDSFNNTKVHQKLIRYTKIHQVYWKLLCCIDSRYNFPIHTAFYGIR
jgi:hypothetical protein